MNVEIPEDPILAEKVSRMLPQLKRNGNRLLYGDETCILRENVHDILNWAHIMNIGGHFGFSKVLGRMERFHWKHKTRDNRMYFRFCQRYQKGKDIRTKLLTIKMIFCVPERRWGSMGTGFITRVGSFTRRVHLIQINGKKQVIKIYNAFFGQICRLHGLPDDIVSDRDPNVTPRFCTNLLDLCGVKMRITRS